jgi:hypothetical protein
MTQRRSCSAPTYYLFEICFVITNLYNVIFALDTLPRLIHSGCASSATEQKVAKLSVWFPTSGFPVFHRT